MPVAGAEAGRGGAVSLLGEIDPRSGDAQSFGRHQTCGQIPVTAFLLRGWAYGFFLRPSIGYVKLGHYFIVGGALALPEEACRRVKERTDAMRCLALNNKAGPTTISPYIVRLVRSKLAGGLNFSGFKWAVWGRKSPTPHRSLPQKGSGLACGRGTAGAAAAFSVARRSSLGEACGGGPFRVSRLRRLRTRWALANDGLVNAHPGLHFEM